MPGSSSLVRRRWQARAMRRRCGAGGGGGVGLGRAAPCTSASTSAQCRKSQQLSFCSATPGGQPSRRPARRRPSTCMTRGRDICVRSTVCVPRPARTGCAVRVRACVCACVGRGGGGGLSGACERALCGWLRPARVNPQQRDTFHSRLLLRAAASQRAPTCPAPPSRHETTSADVLSGGAHCATVQTTRRAPRFCTGAD